MRFPAAMAIACLALLGPPARLAAADAPAAPPAPEPLRPPALLEVHPDGARLISYVPVHAGVQLVVLPVRAGSRWLVIGASACSIARGAPAPAQLPKALVDLLASRDALVAGMRAHTAGLAELEALAAAFRRTLPRLAHLASPDPKAWQATLDALLAARKDLDAQADTLEAERARLREAATALAPNPAAAAQLRGLDEADPALVLDAATLQERWEGLPPSPSAATLELTAAASGTVTVEEERADLQWSPSLRIAVHAGVAVLERAVRIGKARGLELGSLPVIATTLPLHPTASAPNLPATQLGIEAARPSERTAVLSGEEEVTVTQSSPLSSPPSSPIVAPTATKGEGSGPPVGGMAAAKAEPETPSGQEGQEPHAASLGPAVTAMDMLRPLTQPAAQTPHPLQWLLPPVALPAGVARASAALPSQPLAVVVDEWALMPDLAPVALRRMVVRADEGIPAGRLELLVDGVPRSAETLPATAAGGQIQLRLAEDDTIVVGADKPWAVDPAEQTTRSQRQGRDRWIWNLGPATRTIRVYATCPVSRSQGITVTIDAATTGGYEVVEPGVLRWSLPVPTGAPTRLGVGWRLAAAEGLHL